MARRPHVELIEIPTEELSYVPGERVDLVAMFGRWAATSRDGDDGPTGARRGPPSAIAAGAAPSVVGDFRIAFRRLIEVPGDRLATALAMWWQQAAHDDGHLRLEAPRPVSGCWALSGVFRRRSTSRWLPVELLLSPYSGRWSLLELMPRRSTRPSAGYFREGHRSLDRFVADLRGAPE
jgi:hypothetical protein